MARFSYAIGRLCRDSGSHLPFDPPLSNWCQRANAGGTFPTAGAGNGRF